MVYGLETVAVTKKQVEEIEVEKMKILMFAIGVTRKIRLEMSTSGLQLRVTVKVERLAMKMREGRLRWYGHVVKRDQEYVGRGMIEMELPGKRKRRRSKRKFQGVVKDDMRKVDAREKDIENMTLWSNIIHCGYP